MTNISPLKQGFVGLSAVPFEVTDLQPRNGKGFRGIKHIDSTSLIERSRYTHSWSGLRVSAHKCFHYGHSKSARDLPTITS
jgi:hypothetical protein